MKGISNYILWIGLALIVFAFSLSLWYRWSSSIRDTQLYNIQKVDLDSLEATVSNVCDNSVGTKICITFHYTKFLESLDASGKEICYVLKNHKKVCKKILCDIKKQLDLKSTDPLIKPALDSRGYSILSICAEKAGDTYINMTYSIE